jgi:dTDP-4-dehydrorhamnose 3,5-epimerase
MSADRFTQLYVPVGFAHGFCVTSEVADVEYKCSEIYDPQGEAGLIWNDPGVGVDWPIKAPLVSAKDSAYGRLSPSRPDLL